MKISLLLISMSYSQQHLFIKDFAKQLKPYRQTARIKSAGNCQSGNSGQVSVPRAMAVRRPRKTMTAMARRKNTARKTRRIQ